jgi:hypothetical protein
MVPLRWRLLDGLVTGALLSALCLAPCAVAGQALSGCGSRVFLAGAGLAATAILLALADREPSRGLLGPLVPRSDPVEPGAPVGLRTRWDRALSSHNVWLIAGGTMLALSFLPPILA